MTPSEWADVLAGLHDEDKERAVALLQMSDEDWLREDARDWLRARAGDEHRAGNLRPEKRLTAASGYYWRYPAGGTAPWVVPESVSSKMTEDPLFRGYSIDYPTLAGAWLALLEGMR